MRFKLAIVLLTLLLSATVSTANPGGKGDDVRSRDCAGSCHASSSSNGVSTASLNIIFPNEVYAGLLIEVNTSVGNIDVSSNNMVGMTLLINSDGAKDLPANDGWEVVTDPNGGTNNYVEISDSFSSQNIVNRSWTLRAPSDTGTYELYLAVQHGTPEGGVAMTGISQAKSVIVEEVPENLPRLSEDWTPTNQREIGVETIITIETINVESATVELMNGAEIITIPVVDNEFTIPAAVNPGTVQWRLVMEGEGPTQYSPWFRITAQEPGWQVDETALYLQGVALFLLCAGLVVLRRKDEENLLKDYDNTVHLNESSFENQDPLQVQPIDEQVTITNDVQQTPPLPASGLPQGWTMEQWEYYGQEHLDNLAEEGAQ
tara:strand:+ start:1273 stop:2397 length:1125 start_codon:yes stop_codon:yes gene_type:complete